MEYNVNLFDETEKTRFVVDNDSKAEWCLTKIADAKAEHERMCKLIAEKEADLNRERERQNSLLERSESFFGSKLQEYFLGTPEGQVKETNTLLKYQLLSGALVMKKERAKMFASDHLVERLIDDNMTEFIKETKTVQWGEYKKRLAMLNDKVFDIVTGEEITDVNIAITPAKFEVKLK